jgi:hypothetical protein
MSDPSTEGTAPIANRVADRGLDSQVNLCFQCAKQAILRRAQDSLSLNWLNSLFLHVFDRVF